MSDTNKSNEQASYSTDELSDDGSPLGGLLCTKDLLDGRCVVDRCDVCIKPPEIVAKVKKEIEEEKAKAEKRKAKELLKEKK